METETRQQEILLFTNTHFSQRELSEKLETDNRSSYSAKEKLQKACWNGLLNDMLPELIDNKKLFIWQIQEGNNFLCIDLSAQPTQNESFYTINPYRFLAEVNNN